MNKIQEAILALLLVVSFTGFLYCVYRVGDAVGYERGFKAGQESQVSQENLTKACVAWWFDQEKPKDMLARHKQAKAAYCKGAP